VSTDKIIDKLNATIIGTVTKPHVDRVDVSNRYFQVIYLLVPTPTQSPSMVALPFEGLLIILHDLYFPLAVAVWQHIMHRCDRVFN